MSGHVGDDLAFHAEKEENRGLFTKECFVIALPFGDDEICAAEESDECGITAL